MNLNELTPLQEHNGILLKRDDLFMPFNDISLSGGKVRQCLTLFKDLKSKIKNDFNNTVYAIGSANSPQSIIVTRCAKEFDFNSKIFIPKNIRSDNVLIQNVLGQGGTINNQAKVGHTSVMNSFIQKYSQLYKGFIVNYTSNVLESECNGLLMSVANQVQNLPDLEYLIVPCGSCIMLSGILIGIRKFKKNIRNVLGIQISGHNKVQFIKTLSGTDRFELIVRNDYPYSKWVKSKIGDIELDPLYEAKAFEYIQKFRPEVLNAETCFWLSGNSIPVRTNVFSNISNVNDFDSITFNALGQW